MGTKKLFAVDPSLTCSGWALFDLNSKALMGVGSITTLGPEYSMATRLRRLQDNISGIFEQVQLQSGDVLICEDATSMKDPTAVAKLERVRGIFETLARNLNMEVPGRVHPRTVQHELLGLRGKQLDRSTVKGSARSVVVHLFGDALKKIQFETSEAHLKRAQDIVDALLVGAICLTRIEEAGRMKLSLEDFFHSIEQRRGANRSSGAGL